MRSRCRPASVEAQREDATGEIDREGRAVAVGDARAESRQVRLEVERDAWRHQQRGEDALRLSRTSGRRAAAEHDSSDGAVAS